MTDRHKTLISDKLSTYLTMMFIACVGGVMSTLLWMGAQPQPPVLNPTDAYCHGMVETLVLFGAPFSVSEADCHELILNTDFEAMGLTGPLGLGVEDESN